MSAERNPPAKESYFAAPLHWAVRHVLKAPQAALSVAAASALACCALAWFQLGYRASRLDLLDPKSDYNRLWIEYLDEFGAEEDAVVVVEGPGREQVVPAMQDLAGELADDRALFHAVWHEIDLSKLQAKGLHFLPEPELARIEGFLDETAPVVAGDWSRLNLSNLLAGLTERAAQRPKQLRRFANALLAAVENRPGGAGSWLEPPRTPSSPGQAPSQPLLAQEGRQGFVLLRLKPGEAGFAQGSEAVDALRAIVAEVAARHPQTTLGVTGLPVLENDEMRSANSSMIWSSALSLFGVALLFVAGFGGVRHALLANLLLLVGMAWAFGYAALAVGHLNILSVSFTVSLIGIGIDYGVHYVARYLQLRDEGLPCRDALLGATRGVGPAIVTGALATSAAFFAAAFTPFAGVAELGIIAGGGLLLCAAAELLLLPAAILLVDEANWNLRAPRPLPVHRWVAPLLVRPGRTLWGAGIVTAILSLGLGRLWYDHNLLNLPPAGLESVELERKLLADGDRSSWHALSLAGTPEELLALKDRMSALPSVERTEEIVSMLPLEAGTKRQIVERIGSRLVELPEKPPLIPVDRPEELASVLAAAEASLLSHDPAAAEALRQIGEAMQRLPAATRYRRLSAFQQQTAQDLIDRLRGLRETADPEPPQLADLPEELRRRFLGNGGRHLLKIYGRGDIWDMATLARFVSEVRSVDPRATGNPLQAYEASLEMKRSYELAALYALAAILAVLLIDFRSLPYAALAALPLGLGMVQTFGTMGLLGLPLNPANLIALPLILGIGVDYGVHMVHEYRERPANYRLSPSTAVAVLVDGLTTIVGFGALMIASHRGLQSLGQLLTLGVTCCMFSSMIVLPALLTWMSRRLARRTASVAVAADPRPSRRRRARLFSLR